MAKSWNLVMIGMDGEIAVSPSSPYERRDAVALAENFGSLGVRAWVEHVKTGRRFFENEPERLARHAGAALQQLSPGEQPCDHGLVPGMVSPEHFELLVALTKLPDDGHAKSALFDHFVNGVDRIAARKTHDISASQFKRRITAIERISAIVKQLAPFYRGES